MLKKKLEKLTSWIIIGSGNQDLHVVHVQDDSPGKNTGVGCHFLLQCMNVRSESEVAQSCLTLSDPMDCSPPGSSLCPWDSPGKSTGVGNWNE